MFFVLTALAFAFASCSNSAGGGSPSGVPIVYTDTGVTNSGNDINPLLLSQEERLQTEHVKIEKLQNGLKFTITRPSDDCYDSSKCKEIKKTDANGNPIFSYDYVGYGKGSYERYLEDVGQGNGDYKDHKYVGQGNGNVEFLGKFHYKNVGYPNGTYERNLTQVGEGEGYFKYIYIDVGQGNGAFKLENGQYIAVGNQNGNYNLSLEYVGAGNGDFKYDFIAVPQGSYSYTEELVDYYVPVQSGKGSYVQSLEYVGAGNGNMKYVYTYIGPGNGSYEYTDTQKVYGGWGWTAIYRAEIIGGKEVHTTCASFNTSVDASQTECFYPLCDAGERYVFRVYIEPSDIDNNRKFQKAEYLAVTALGGIGDIDYANTLSGRTIDLSYNYKGENPVVKVSGYIPPTNARNARTSIAYFATNQSDALSDGTPDWNTNNATKWFATYGSENGIEYDVDKDFSYSGKSFKTLFDEKNKDSLYAEYFFTFDVPESSGIDSWGTPRLGSKILKIR